MDQLGAVSSEVINDFCHPSLNFHDSFLDIPLLQNQLTDTHFYERDRMGRAIVSLGHHQPSFNIIAASEATSIFIDESGIGVVDGDNEIYIIKESNNTQRLQLICGQKVIYSNLKRIKLINGQHYDFIQHSHNGKELEVSIDGTEDPFYIPANPY
jgi:cyanophycinase-like exopeptidase